MAGTAPEPDPVAAFLRAVVRWPDELPVLFVEHRDDAILATWGSFVAAWPRFLSLSDEGPLVVSWERQEFLRFWTGGPFGIGMRGPADPSRRAMQRTCPPPADDLSRRTATVYHDDAARSDAKLKGVCGMPVYGPQFFFEGDLVGLFIGADGPRTPGPHEFEPRFGPGYSRMSAIQGNGDSLRCYYEVPGERVSFTVEGRPYSDVLELDEFEVTRLGSALDEPPRVEPRE